MRVAPAWPLVFCSMALRGGADELGSDSREAVGEKEILFVAPKSRWQRWDTSLLCPLLPHLLCGEG